MACSPVILDAVLEVTRQLSPDPFAEAVSRVHLKARAALGDHYRYGDITTFLFAVAKAGQPSRYLEIGVRRGRSMAMVACASPRTNLLGFDLWQANYADNANPGPEFVSAEISRISDADPPVLVSGDSHETVPAYLREHPDLAFDLITVDGDHSPAGALDDLRNVAPRLAVGGVLVFDDIDNPYCPGLDAVWSRFVAEDEGLDSLLVPNALGLGVAVAIRRQPGRIPKRSRRLWRNRP